MSSQSLFFSDSVLMQATDCFMCPCPLKLDMSVTALYTSEMLELEA